MKFDIQAFQRMEHGGIPSYFIELSRHINSANISNFCVEQDGVLTSNPELSTDTLFPIHFKSKYFRPIARYLNPRISRIKNFDLIHSTYYHETFLRKIQSNRHIVTIHDMIPEDFPEQFSGSNPHLAKSKYVQESAAIICVSESTKSRLLAHHPEIPKDSIFVVHHGSKFSSSMKEFNDNRSRRKSSDDIFRILYVGSRFGYKNFQVLLKAARILEEEGIKFEIRCAGGGDFTKAELTSMREYGLENAVLHFRAKDVDLKKLYLISHCQITTSFAEGFGLPLLEAMSLGCPTVISSTEALQEVSGGSSLVFDPTDHHELASHIRTLEQSKEIADRIASLGFQRSKMFNWNNTAAQTVAVYSHVLAKCN